MKEISSIIYRNEETGKSTNAILISMENEKPKSYTYKFKYYTCKIKTRASGVQIIKIMWGHDEDGIDMGYGEKYTKQVRKITGEDYQLIPLETLESSIDVSNPKYWTNTYYQFENRDIL